MEFDKSKILTVVTGNKELEGKFGWFGYTLTEIKENMRKKKPEKLLSFGETRLCPFEARYFSSTLFYPAPEPTYAELQAEWVKQNDVKCGTKVRFIKDFNNFESGSDCYGHSDAIGRTATIISIDETKIIVDMAGGYNMSWYVPYMALEIIKETIRPFNEDELNNLVGKIVRNKQTGYRKLVTGKPTTSLGVNLEGKYINAKDLLNSFMMDDGKSPCGVKEEV